MGVLKVADWGFLILLTLLFRVGAFGMPKPVVAAVLDGTLVATVVLAARVEAVVTLVYPCAWQRDVREG